MQKIIFLLLMVPAICFGQLVSEPNYTNEEICDSIWYAEGGNKTKFPYGIKSVYCYGEEECRNVCLNTVKNNRKRYKEYGYKNFETYLSFLASKYCPISVRGCENWERNVRYFLEKNK